MILQETRQTTFSITKMAAATVLAGTGKTKNLARILPFSQR
jgi:hypothetical protein